MLFCKFEGCIFIFKMAFRGVPSFEYVIQLDKNHTKLNREGTLNISFSKNHFFLMEAKRKKNKKVANDPGN